MKSIVALAVVTVLAAGATLAKPVVNEGGVVNAASYALDGLPHSGIAQGSLFVVFGKDMGPATLEHDFEWPLATELAGTTVRVTVGATTVDAIMIYTSALQVAAMMPSATPVGNGTLTVTYAGQTSNAVNVHVVQSRFGIFARNQAGSGPAIVQNWVSQEEQPVNALTRAAHRNQVMVLWGTGLGPVPFDETQPPVAGNLPVDVEVWVGGKQAAVQYKGRSSYASIDQINFVIPADAPLGCYVPVAVKAAGVVSNFGTIAISADGDVCSDANSYSAADLQKAQAQGFLDVGRISLNRSSTVLGPFEMNGDSGDAQFSRFEYSTLLSSQGMTGAPSFGSCMVYSAPGRNLVVADPVSVQPLDAGSALNLTGPKGPKQLVRQTMGSYGAVLGGGGIGPGVPDYIEPGQYQAHNGSGGTDIGPFSATLNIPAMLQWTNENTIANVIRTQAQQVTWEGGDPNGTTVIVGGSIRQSPEAGVAFICTESTSAGQFTIPAFVLSALPASGMEAGFPTGFLSVGHAPRMEQTVFQAQGLDVGRFYYRVSRMKNLIFQ